jgi:hypothetical protein
VAVYTYYLFDLVSGAQLGTLPLKQVTFASRLNQIGDFSAVLELADPAVQAAAPIDLTNLGRTAIYVDRDGALVWGGILWTRNYRSLDRTLSIAGQDFTSYFFRRVLYAARSYVAVDPLTAAQDLIAYAQSAQGNIGVAVSAPASSGAVVTQAWNPWDLKEIASAIQDLSASATGFDYGVDVTWAAGVPAITLTLSFPRRGRAAPNSGLVWEYPGNIVDYEWPEDGTRIATNIYEVGSGQGATMLLATSANPALLDSGYPVLDWVGQHKDVTDPTVLANFAIADALAHAGPLTLPVLNVRANLDPKLGDYGTGDDARLRLTDARFPAPTAGGSGTDTYWRIYTIEVTPQDTGPEDVKITFGSPPP